MEPPIHADGSTGSPTDLLISCKSHPVTELAEALRPSAVTVALYKINN
jgi:hypothetical protein